MNDAVQLKEFLENRSETAFRALVERHLTLVLGTARRITSDPSLAEDVAQTVFILLARKASELKETTILAGWLYRTTHFVASRALLSEQRRRRREQESFAMQLPPDPDPLWNRVAPQLDAALRRLSESDRTALLLRYFEEKPLREIALDLGINEEAAKKRVNRALEKLKRVLARRGMEISATALGIGLARESAQAADSAALVQKFTSLALADLGSGSGALSTASTLLTEVAVAQRWAQLKTAIAGFLAVVGVALVTVSLVVFIKSRTNGANPLKSAPLAAQLGSDQQAAGRRRSSSQTAVKTGTTTAAHSLHLIVLDQASGKPIPGVAVTHQLMFGPQGQAPEPLHTDASGSVAIDIPDLPGLERMDQFGVWLTAKDYAPRAVNWLSTTGNVLRIVSSEYTVRLESGIRLAGTVTDDSGQPLAGVHVGVIGNAFKGYEIGRPEVRAEDFPVIAIAAEGPKATSITTDEAGRFVIDHFPSDLHAAMFELVAQDGSRRKFRTPEANHLTVETLPEVSLEELRAGTAKLILPRGVPVDGVVSDSSDKPMPGATVTEAVQSGNLRVLSTNQTDVEGRFRLPNRRPRELILTASAEGYADASRAVLVRSGMEPVRFRLSKERPLQGRVLNQAHEPVAGAAVMVVDYLAEPQGSQWTGRSDLEGRFVWRKAPTNEVALSIESPGYARQIARVRPSPEESVITLRPQGSDPIQVTGLVTDSDTGAPVEDFRVKVSHESTEGIPSRPGRTIESGAGQFELELSKSEVPVGMMPVWALIIEADGYETTYTRMYDYDEGDQQLQITLHPGGFSEGVVLTPDGKPAAEAQIGFALFEDPAYSAMPGKLLGPYAAGAADQQGHWKLPKPLNARALIVLHDSGWSATELKATSAQVQLAQWGRVEGVASSGETPLAHEQISLRPLAWDWSLLFYIGYQAKTDAEGHFAFEKVPAGEYIASLENGAWQVNGQPNLYALQTPVTVQNGETVTIRVASAGSSVTAQLVVDRAAGDFAWNDVLAVLTTDGLVPSEPTRGDYISNQSFMAARMRYTHDPTVLAALRAARTYVGQVDPAGNLLFEQVPPGRYICEVKLYQNRKGHFTPGLDEARLLARVRVPISVPERSANADSAPAVDLGKLRLANL